MAIKQILRWKGWGVSALLCWAAASVSAAVAPAGIRVEPQAQALQGARAAIQHGRETGDAADFNRAETLLRTALVRDPRDADALGLRAWVALFRHQFRDAAALGERARRAAPYAGFNYGVLSDAYLELGDYTKSIHYAERMLALHPDQGAYSRAAHLRSLHGDAAGAIELWRMAIRAGAAYPENTAWCQVELGDEYFNSGDMAAAGRAYRAALAMYPGYHRAQAGLARLRAAQGDAAGAATLYEQAAAVLPLPQYLSELGDLYQSLGRTRDAQARYAQVSFIARLERSQQVLYNRELALYYAEHGDVAAALPLIEGEARARKDIRTYEALGWVYYQGGRYAAARAAMQQALRLGTRDPRLLFRAGMVMRAAGEPGHARQLLRDALAINPRFHPVDAEAARAALAALS